MRDAIVHPWQLGVEHGVVEAQLEKLCIRELEDVLDVPIIRRRFEHERVFPREDDEVIRVIGKAMMQQLAQRLRRERPWLTKEQRGEAFVSEHRVRVRYAAVAGLERRDSEDDVFLSNGREAGALDGWRDTHAEGLELVRKKGIDLARTLEHAGELDERAPRQHVASADLEL